VSTLCAWLPRLEMQARPMTARCQASLASTSAAEGRERRRQGAEVQERTAPLFLCSEGWAQRGLQTRMPGTRSKS
jgi:hypothetical protein